MQHPTLKARTSLPPFTPFKIEAPSAPGHNNCDTEYNDEGFASQATIKLQRFKQSLDLRLLILNTEQKQYVKP